MLAAESASVIVLGVVALARLGAVNVKAIVSLQPKVAPMFIDTIARHGVHEVPAV